MKHYKITFDLTITDIAKLSSNRGHVLTEALFRAIARKQKDGCFALSEPTFEEIQKEN